MKLQQKRDLEDVKIGLIKIIDYGSSMIKKRGGYHNNNLHGLEGNGSYPNRNIE